MLVRKDLPNDPAVSAGCEAKPGTPDLHAVLDSENLETHTLLLLFLLPEANRSDVDADTTRAVEALSALQDRLSCTPEGEPFEKDMLAEMLESLSGIRFGLH